MRAVRAAGGGRSRTEVEVVYLRSRSVPEPASMRSRLDPQQFPALSGQLKGDSSLKIYA